MSAEAIPAVLCGIAELTLEADDLSGYLADPAGNVVEVWDFFTRAHGAREGVRALA